MFAVDSRRSPIPFVDAATGFKSLGALAFARHVKSGDEDPWWPTGMQPLPRNVVATFIGDAHAQGLRIMTYYWHMSEKRQEDFHPKWVCRKRNGKAITAAKRGHYLDITGPYREVVLTRLRELAAMGADGLFFDESFQYIGDADWMARLQMHHYRFGRIERPVGMYRHHCQQVSAIASTDQAADALRRAEHDRFHRHYRTSRLLRRPVLAYDRFQQRRVKALAAWRRGGAAGVGGLVQAWFSRKYDRD